MGSYIPSTREERQQMLEAVGCASLEELFSHIPEEVKLDRLGGQRRRSALSPVFFPGT